MTPEETLVGLLKKLGLPVENALLAARAAELKVKLTRLLKYTAGVGETIHEHFKHPRDFEDCQEEICQNLWKILRSLEP